MPRLKRTYLVCLFTLLVLVASPLSAQRQPADGGLTVENGRWLVFSLPEFIRKPGGAATTYRGNLGHLAFEVRPLLPHPGEQALVELRQLASAEEAENDVHRYHNALVESRKQLDEWAKLFRKPRPYELKGVHTPSPLSKETQTEIQDISQALKELLDHASPHDPDYSALREGAAPLLKRLEARLGSDADRLLLRLVVSQSPGMSYQLGNLTSTEEVVLDKNVLRMSNALRDRSEEIVFLEVDNRTYAFSFRHDPSVDLNRLIRVVVGSARHTTSQPEFSQPVARVHKKNTGLLLEPERILQTPIALVTLLILAHPGIALGGKAFDVCRSRRRLSIRESLRIFQSFFITLLIVGLGYLGLVYIESPYAGELLKREDLAEPLLVPGLLLVLLTATLAVIGARLGFHRSKLLCQYGAVFGLLLGLLISYHAVSFLLI